MILDFDGGLWGGGGGGGGGGGNNFSSRGSGMGMRGGGMDMKGGGNFRGNCDNWNGGNNSHMHCVHMRGLPFRATEQDIADVIDYFY